MSWENLEIAAAILELDGEFAISRANSTACKWLGRSREELLGTRFDALLARGSRFFFMSHIYPLLISGEPVEEVYLSLLCGDGSSLPVLVNAQKLDSGREHLVFLPMRRRALFERHLLDSRRQAEAAAQAEQEALRRLKEVQSRLAMQDRLAAMGTLAAGVAHELNNPLAYVLGNLEILQEESLEGEAPELLADIREGVERIRTIVASLKVVSRAEEHRSVQVDLQQVCGVAIRLVSKQMQMNCQLHCHSSAETCLIMGDEGRLTQVLINLLLNASQAFPTSELRRNRVDLTTWACGSQTGYEVRDNGPGVAPEIASRIFDPFFTTKPVGKGTGLGLSICQGIVQSLGGSLELTCPEEGGACFRVSLPRAGALRLSQADS